MKIPVLALSLIAVMTVPAFAVDDFVKVDADGDGQVSFDELTASGLNWTKDKFTGADADHNGTLSMEEYDSAAK
jgi:EF hand